MINYSNKNKAGEAYKVFLWLFFLCNLNKVGRQRPNEGQGRGVKSCEDLQEESILQSDS